MPAQLRAKVILRPRYGCRATGDAVVQALAPERPIDGGMATEALLVHVLVSKFCDFLPLYCQSEMLKRQGMSIDRSTLSDWVVRTCWWLRPLGDLTLSTVLSAPVVFADDTTLPVLDPGRGKTKTGRLWCYARSIRGPGKARGNPRRRLHLQPRPQGQASPPNISPASAASCRSMATYPEFPALAKRGTIELVFCWAHCRRHFYDFHAATKSAGSPLSALAQIARTGLCDRGRDPRPAAPSTAVPSASSAAVRSSRRCRPG